MLTLRKTPLFEEHKKLGAKLVDFAGFEMPVQYQGIISEHSAVRTKAGIFDVSHMGEFVVSGKDALNFLNYLVPNDIKKIEESGKGLYTQLCNEKGGTVDDLIIYRTDSDFLVVVNASNIEKDWQWFNKYKNSFNVELKNISDSTSLLALQGPKAFDFLSTVLKISPDSLKLQKYFDIKKYQSTWVARTGYTGEDGFEVFIDNSNHAVSIWQELVKLGVVPCGLGARDTLRLEAAYPLYGHELDDETSPLEAGLGWSIKLDKKEDFIGKASLLKQKQDGLKKKFACLKINDKVIARQGHKVFSKDGSEIGTVCSGSQGITVGYPIATSYIKPSYSEPGKEVFISIREKLISASVIQRPFYKKA
ncbi:MAG: glycine cleavage system aminomethyltransferase GcvT [Candidatus Melainabacteria bacterium]|nr:glycine cleavage system aminomethyltransferase GcvT [Candidatus Melainabacteria bacterium]